MRKILDAALELFGTVGYESTSISKIAAKAGVSKGLIYNYFESKDDLLRKLIDDLLKVGDDLMADAYVDDPKKTLENIIRLLFKWFRKNDRLNRLLFGLSTQIDRFDFIHELANTKMNGYILMLEELLKAADIADHKTEARILATVFDGIGVQYMVLKDDYPLDEMESMLVKKYCS